MPITEMARQRDRDRRLGISREIRTKIDALKAKPCMDCGRTFPPVCMDFDHRDPTTKVSDVAKLASGTSWARIEAEISKCDLVCACCHRIRTAAKFSRREIEQYVPVQTGGAGHVTYDPTHFNCGHARTPENTTVRGNRPRGRCKTCDRAYTTNYLKTVYRERLLAAKRAYYHTAKAKKVEVSCQP